jgi:deoxyribonuclease (pyrimidine dimer)
MGDTMSDKSTELLKKAAAQFKFYENQHLEKGTDEGRQKALVNGALADEIYTHLISEGKMSINTGSCASFGSLSSSPMTRINLVDPKELHPLHLGAEYYELPRVFGLARKAIIRGESPDNPRYHQGYCRGKGHVLFFYPRLLFLRDRQQRLVRELVRRGVRPNFTAPVALDEFDASWCMDYKPSMNGLNRWPNNPRKALKRSRRPRKRLRKARKNEWIHHRRSKASSS